MAQYRSFLFPEATVEKDFILLDSRESHHLARVFRATKGETIEALDGKGTHYFGRIQSVSPKAVSITVEAIQSVPVARPSILLLQSESKAKSMDLVLRMATEIGVSAIQPVFTDQGEHQKRKLEKRVLTMIEACKQCGLSYLPELHESCHLKDWLQSNPQKSKTLRLVASLEDNSRPLVNVLKESPDIPDEIVIAIGPTGDFSDSEYEGLRSNGFKAIQLGANVLRVETAVAYSLSIIDQIARICRT